MKILTWNLERPSRAKAMRIMDVLMEKDADILILTETHAHVDLRPSYSCIQTQALYPGYDGNAYRAGENRVSIWSRYPVIYQYETSDGYTSVCSELKTPLGPLRIYGTIIGVFGGKNARFKEDLASQLQDFHRLLENKPACIAGDLNISLSGYTYPSKAARESLTQCMERLNLHCLTADLPYTVDHIALSNEFIQDRKLTMEVWNEDKGLSDHIGICVTIE